MIEEPPLPPAFRGPALDSSTPVVLLDDGLLIVWVNPAWGRFALENGGTPEDPSWAPGAGYLDAISIPLRAWYARALGDALAGTTPWHHEYDCPSPEIERRFRLTAYPLAPVGGKGLLIDHTPLVSWPAGEGAPVALYRDSNGLVHVCMHCRRTRRLDEGGWDWVPDALVAPAAVSHGICGPCHAYYFGDLWHG